MSSVREQRRGPFRKGGEHGQVEAFGIRKGGQRRQKMGAQAEVSLSPPCTASVWRAYLLGDGAVVIFEVWSRAMQGEANQVSGPNFRHGDFWRDASGEDNLHRDPGRAAFDPDYPSIRGRLSWNAAAACVRQCELKRFGQLRRVQVMGLCPLETGTTGHARSPERESIVKLPSLRATQWQACS